MATRLCVLVLLTVFLAGCASTADQRSVEGGLPMSAGLPTPLVDWVGDADARVVARVAALYSDRKELVESLGSRHSPVDRTQPRVVSSVLPHLSAAARAAKKQGAVTVVFVVTRDGLVEDARVLDTEDLALDEPVLTAVRAWRFKPGLMNHRRVDCVMMTVVECR